MKSFTLIIFILTVLPFALSSQDMEIITEVNTNTLMRGESGRYSIKFLNTNSIPQLNTPTVPGLEFSNSPQTNQLQQIVNGVVTREIQLTWYFRGRETGTYTIPGQTLNIRGEAHKIEPITIEIVENDVETNSNYFLRFVFDSDPIYLGQAFTAELKLFTRADIQISPKNLNRRGDGFIHQLVDGQAESIQTLIEGTRYIVRTWRLGMTPIKSGKQELAFELAADISRQTSRDPFGGIFNLSRINSEPVSIYTPTQEINVLEVPQENRPPSFGGAIGQFDFEAKLSTRELQVGEPFTLTLSLNGKGNFDRIQTPEIDLNEEHWRTYPPKQDFVPSDNLGHAGVLTFEYIIIPQTDTIESFPKIEYATFNPETTTFVTNVLEEDRVTIAPARLNTSNGFTGNSDTSAEDPNKISPDRLRANLPDFGSPQSIILPTYLDKKFWIIQIAIAIILCLLLLILDHRRKLESDTDYASQFSKSKRVKKHFVDAENALHKKDTEAFFASAARALKVKIALLNSIRSSSDSLVVSELIDILQSKSVDPNTISRLKQFFEKADAIHFAAFKFSHDELENEFSTFKQLLKSIPNK